MIDRAQNRAMRNAKARQMYGIVPYCSFYRATEREIVRRNSILLDHTSTRGKQTGRKPKISLPPHFSTVHQGQTAFLTAVALLFVCFDGEGKRQEIKLN